jgi:hypothetical protein
MIWKQCENENSDDFEQNEQEVISLSGDDGDIECVDDFSTSSSESSFMDEHFVDVGNEVFENLPVANDWLIMLTW